MLYRIPSKVHLASRRPRPVLFTQQGGKVAVDSIVLSLWEYASGKCLEEVVHKFKQKGYQGDTIRAGLACLVSAELLERQGEKSSKPLLIAVDGNLISVILVGYNSREWLEACFRSLRKQTYSPIEIVLVDNGSTDGTAGWVEEHFPEVRLVRLESALSLAAAINTGVVHSRGQSFLILNPDVYLDPNAIANMESISSTNPHCAAVAAKLKFSWAPGFLNGLGNYVGAFSWGSDLGLGHLDLGQFDGVKDIPSACFAAALIPKQAWISVGPLDESFPLYYEDSEWCYRARLMGWQILAAPKAVVYHAFGGNEASGKSGGLTIYKRRCIVYGRLRFTLKLLGPWLRFRYLATYGLEDFISFISAAIRMKWGNAQAYFLSWYNIYNDYPAIKNEQKALELRLKIKDTDVFRLPDWAGPAHIWRGNPELTWDLIQSHYLPRLLELNRDLVPEFSGRSAKGVSEPGRISWGSAKKRLTLLMEGPVIILHRIWRRIQFHLMKG
jgi:GT2 family glycosyltransferase